MKASERRVITDWLQGQCGEDAEEQVDASSETSERQEDRPDGSQTKSVDKDDSDAVTSTDDGCYHNDDGDYHNYDICSHDESRASTRTPSVCTELLHDSFHPIIFLDEFDFEGNLLNSDGAIHPRSKTLCQELRDIVNNKRFIPAGYDKATDNALATVDNPTDDKPGSTDAAQDAAAKLDNVHRRFVDLFKKRGIAVSESVQYDRQSERARAGKYRGFVVKDVRTVESDVEWAQKMAKSLGMSRLGELLLPPFLGLVAELSIKEYRQSNWLMEHCAPVNGYGIAPEFRPFGLHGKIDYALMFIPFADDNAHDRIGQILVDPTCQEPPYSHLDRDHQKMCIYAGIDAQFFARSTGKSHIGVWAQAALKHFEWLQSSDDDNDASGETHEPIMPMLIIRRYRVTAYIAMNRGEGEQRETAVCSVGEVGRFDSADGICKLIAAFVHLYAWGREHHLREYEERFVANKEDVKIDALKSAQFKSDLSRLNNDTTNDAGRDS